jgi:hypothetical protein
MDHLLCNVPGFEVDLDAAIPGGLGHAVICKEGRRRDARVVDDDVHGVKSADRGVHQSSYVVGNPHVSGNPVNVPPATEIDMPTSSRPASSTSPPTIRTPRLAAASAMSLPNPLAAQVTTMTLSFRWFIVRVSLSLEAPLIVVWRRRDTIRCHQVYDINIK